MAGDLVVLLTEEGDEVLVAGLLSITCVGDRGAESGILVVLAEVDDQLGDAHFEGHGHTAFQVETQVDLFLLALAVGVAQQGIDLLFAVGAEVAVLVLVEERFAVLGLVAGHGQRGIGLEVGLLSRLLLHAGGEDGEGHLIRTRQRQEDGEYPKRAPILHDRWFF